MSLRTVLRTVGGAVFGLLVVWLVFLFFTGPTYEFTGPRFARADNAAFTLQCEPAFWGAPWGGARTWTVDLADGNVDADYTISDGLEPRSDAFRRRFEQREPDGEFDLGRVQVNPDPEIQAELNAICANGRAAQTNLMVLMAVPTAILGALVVRPRPVAQKRW